MFETYLSDASHFIERAKMSSGDLGDDEKIREYRASIFLTASALESFVNYIGETFCENSSLTLHERNFLNDIQTEVDPKKGTLVEREKYQSLENKIRYLISKFNINHLNIATLPEWSQFKEFKIFRDQLVHPRDIVNEFKLADYKKHAENGLKVSILLIDGILSGIFDRNLRKQILELANL